MRIQLDRNNSQKEEEVKQHCMNLNKLINQKQDTVIHP
jgi:hypothetical protein